MVAVSTEVADWVMAVGPDGTNENQPGSLPMLRVVMPEWGVRQSYVVESAADVGAAITHAAGAWLDSMPTASSPTTAAKVRIRLLGYPEVSGEAHWIMDEGIRLVFDDASFVSVEQQFGNSRSVDPIQDEPPPVDFGIALLEPITPTEYGLVERLLAVLWHEAENGNLTDAQERQILAIAAMIEAQHRDAEPGQTPRWKMIGALGSGLRYLMKELPKDALAWWKIHDLVAEAGWTDQLPLL